MEKDKPYSCDKKNYKYKDGLHLLFPNLIAETSTYRQLINSIYKDEENFMKLLEDTSLK